MPTGRYNQRVPVHINHAIVAAADKLEARSQEHWADPRCSQPGINHNHGGRGVYFLDPSGNYFEAITRPYAD